MESARLMASCEHTGKLGLSFSLTGNRILGSVEVDLPGVIKKSVTFVLQYGHSGVLEFSVGDDSHQLDFQMLQDAPYRPRRVRAALWTPDLGDIEFVFDDTTSKGVVVLTTPHGLHKFSYDVRKINGYEVTLNLESPYVNNGIATSKFIINTLDDVYRCRVSLNNDHFLSGQFDLKNGGFNSQFELQTTLLPY